MFSPVAKITTERLILSIASMLKWKLRQLDISNALLPGEVKEVYMIAPLGLNKALSGQVCKLQKELYGLE